METLYDLLGALPNDDAEELRAAFRRAVKGAHPDINPGDPDAALKFRQIVRANDILSDEQQRAAYDHLLDLAHAEHEEASKRAVVAGTVHKLASGVVALIGVSIAGAGGYALYMHLAAATLAPAMASSVIPVKTITVAAVEPAAIVTPPQAAPPEASPARPAEIQSPETMADGPADTATVPEQAKAEPAAPSPPAAPPPDIAAAQSAVLIGPPAPIGPPLDLSPPLDPATNATSHRERGVFAYRSGDLSGAVAEFDQAIHLDPKFADAYVDRGIAYYRMGQFDRAFADIDRAKRIEKSKGGPVAAKKPRPHPAKNDPAIAPLFQPRTAGL
jgi:tetratricopeptide (TPR) repeat protein